MPKGVPVATVAIGNAANAGLLAARILGTSDLFLFNKMATYQVTAVLPSYSVQLSVCHWTFSELKMLLGPALAL